MMTHPERVALHNEIHTRPRPPVDAPAQVSHVALLRDRDRPAHPAELERLCLSHGIAPPAAGQSHFYGDFGRFRLKWERHGEFDDYTVYRSAPVRDDPFAEPAIDALPAGWLDSLPGELIAAIHVSVLPDDLDAWDAARLAAALGSGELIGARIAEGAGAAFSDLRLDARGFTRFLVLSQRMTPRQTGRQVQRLIEIEVYRMMAMLGFPQARRASRELDEVDARLAGLVTRLEEAPAEEEPAMLREVTHLSAMVGRISSEASFRFAASHAYHTLVRQRSADLRETRVPGVQTLTEFLERRFGPAMAFCESVARRLGASAERIARASSLLRTRVEIEREQQNQATLEAMNRRAKLQLHLQQTVEGLSVAAIGYYAVGLLAYLFKAGKSMGLPVDPELATGLSVIPVIVLVALGVRHIRAGIQKRIGGNRQGAPAAD